MKRNYSKPIVAILHVKNVPWLLSGSGNQNESPLPKQDEYTDSPQLSKPWDKALWQADDEATDTSE